MTTVLRLTYISWVITKIHSKPFVFVTVIDHYQLLRPRHRVANSICAMTEVKKIRKHGQNCQNKQGLRAPCKIFRQLRNRNDKEILFIAILLTF